MENVSIQLSHQTLHRESSVLTTSFSASSTQISSVDETVSPGELLISFGEFKTSKPIQDRIRKYRQVRGSLSEGLDINEHVSAISLIDVFEINLSTEKYL